VGRVPAFVDEHDAVGVRVLDAHHVAEVWLLEPEDADGFLDGQVIVAHVCVGGGGREHADSRPSGDRPSSDRP
jgi:hypothetical protein